MFQSMLGMSAKLILLLWGKGTRFTDLPDGEGNMMRIDGGQGEVEMPATLGGLDQTEGAQIDH